MASISYQLFVGVDIAAKTAAVAWVGSAVAAPRPFTIPQTPAGFADLRTRLAATGSAPAATLVVLEATSRYWVLLATDLHAAGYHVSVINPKQAHDWAKATARHAKTDSQDARTLAALAASLQPARWTPPPQIYHELHQRLAARDSLLDLRRQLLNQQHALLHEAVVIASVVASQDRILALLSEQVDALTAELLALTEQEDAWAASIARLQTVPGVGLITASWVVVATHNFTRCADAAAASAYAGLVPYVRQSGTSLHGHAGIGPGGHERLRTALYMASVSSIRWNPQLKPFYERLRGRGKPAKVALCAVARKLLHLLWALGTKQQVFDPQRGQPMPAVPLAATAAAA